MKMVRVWKGVKREWLWMAKGMVVLWEGTSDGIFSGGAVKDDESILWMNVITVHDGKDSVLQISCNK